MVIEKNDEYVVYQNKDGRWRVYIRDGHRVISYPRFLMEQQLGRELTDDEDVHHLDHDVTNNDVSNLVVMSKEEHNALHAAEERIDYYDKVMVCSVCGKEFVWSAKSQRYFYRNKTRKVPKAKCGFTSDRPFCSRSCAAKYSREVQLGRITK